jgi:hypothetical protein
MSKPGRPRIILELTPLASDAPLAVRLRHLLKFALRAQQLRAVEIREADADAPAVAQGNAAGVEEGPGPAAAGGSAIGTPGDPGGLPDER